MDNAQYLNEQLKMLIKELSSNRVILNISMSEWGSKYGTYKSNAYESICGKIGEIIERYKILPTNISKREYDSEPMALPEGATYKITEWNIHDLDAEIAIKIKWETQAMSDSEHQTPSVDFILDRFKINYCSEDHVHLVFDDKASEDEKNSVLKRLKEMNFHYDYYDSPASFEPKKEGTFRRLFQKMNNMFFPKKTLIKPESS